MEVNACGKIGHIAKFCTENQQSSNVTSFENTKPNFRPAQRTMVNVEIGGKNVELSYDTGSQFSIITKQAYDSLPCKFPLVEVKPSGIGIDNHRFTFEGVGYLTLSLSYEPILVSNHVKSNILGAKTESRFKSCTRDFEQQTLVYTTTKNENVFAKCYKEQLNVTSHT